jgi:hypothetical protein
MIKAMGFAKQNFLVINRRICMISSQILSCGSPQAAYGEDPPGQAAG